MNRQLHILHAVERLDRRGVDTWLMHVLRNAPPHWRTGFLVHESGGEYEQEIRQLGGRILLCSDRLSRRERARAVRRLLQVTGPYDVVHSHLRAESGLVLRAAARAGVPVRVAHAHTGVSAKELGAQAQMALMRASLRRNATHGLASSAQAARCLYGRRWHRDPRHRVLLYGFDFTPFAELPSSWKLRQDLHLPTEGLIIGHVGSFDAAKNHRFLVDVFAAFTRSHPAAHLLMVGSGPLRSQVRDQVEQLQLASRVTFTGSQADVAPYYGAMDAVLLPSLEQGSSVVMLEAQAAGLPILTTLDAPAEMNVVPGLVHRLPLSEGPFGWARATDFMLLRPHSRPRSETAHMVADAGYSIAACLARLDRIYWRAAGPAGAALSDLGGGEQELVSPAA